MRCRLLYRYILSINSAGGVFGKGADAARVELYHIPDDIGQISIPFDFQNDRGVSCRYGDTFRIQKVSTMQGGTDFVSIYLSEKKGVDSWNFILAFNIVIIGVAGVLFGMEKALYSIIYQYASTQILHMLYKRYQKQTLFIVTNKPNEVCQAINLASMHGATVLSGEGSYEHRKRQVVYSVVSKEESKRVIRAVKEADPAAFVNALRTEELSGRFYQKPTE